MINKLLVFTCAIFIVGCESGKFSGDSDKKQTGGVTGGSDSKTIDSPAFEPTAVVEEKDILEKLVLVPVVRTCTILNGLFENNATIKEATDGVVIKVKNYANGEITVYDQDKVKYRDDITNTGKFTIPADDGLYEVDVCDPKREDCLDKTKIYNKKSSIGRAYKMEFVNGGTKGIELRVNYKEGSISGSECDDKNSPLIIDLADSGVLLSAPTKGVQFDIDGNGSKEQISWPVNAGNAFVALDVNLNGQIDSGAELFGNHSIGPDGAKSDNGFLALAKYDDDKNGKIDSRDAVFALLKLWEDSNHDGLSAASELSSLSARGVTEIDLNYIDMNESDAWGNETRQRSLVRLENGASRKIFDVWFREI